MKQITIIDICGADYLTDHRGVVGVYWDGERMTRAEFREKLADEIDGLLFDDSKALKQWDKALKLFDAEPDNAVFLEADADVIEAVNDSEECTTIWVALR